MAGPGLLRNAVFPFSLLLPIAAATAIVVESIVELRDAWLVVALSVPPGVLAWTLIEYLLHRFVLHGVEPFRRWHQEHHEHPDVPMRIPVAYGVTLVVALVALPAVLIGDAALAAGIALGLIAGHAVQEATHHRLHHGPAGGMWLDRLRRAHEFHHQRSARAEFGTLTLFWDRVFRTAAPRA